MHHFDAAAVEAALPYGALVDALDEAFRGNITTPVRHHYEIPVPDARSGTMLLMPAWQAGAYTVVKVVSVFPDNARTGKASVQGLVLLLDATTGVPLATFDGPTLTRRRTAAASALAARYLARGDARRLLILGTGAIGREMAPAHAAVRAITTVRVWNRTAAGATDLATRLRRQGFDAEAVALPEDAIGISDIVSCATMSPTPLFTGRDLTPGTHVDAVGAFRPDMRETDDDTVRRASMFVDTREGAMAEAGDLLVPMRAGVISEASIMGDLFDLCRGGVPGRQSEEEITFFKSVGTGVEDWAAAVLAYRARDAVSG